MLNIGSCAGVFESDRADIALIVEVQHRVFIKVLRFRYGLIAKFEVKGVRILEVLQFHGLYLRSKPPTIFADFGDVVKVGRSFYLAFVTRGRPGEYSHVSRVLVGKRLDRWLA
jgi:hypothetical protein